MILAQKLAISILNLAIRHRFFAALIAVPCFGIVAAFGVAPSTFVEPVQINNVVEAINLPTVLPLSEGDSAFIREERIQRGDTVASLLARLNIDDPDALQVLRNSPQARALRQLVPGRSVRASTDTDGKLVSLRYLSGDTLLSLDRDSSGVNVKQEKVQQEKRILMKSAQIRSSLFGASDEAGLSDAVAMQLVDIFSGDIDFQRDLRKGDRFSVVYEGIYNRGELVKTGRVLAAEFVNQNKSYQAVYFEYAENQGGYYTLDGKNLRKQFLKSPLEFSRITSGFSTGRFHPILQKWRAHTGVDYGAPTGTRVKATADGIVDFAGRQGGYGNVVVLRHQSNYTTWYGHLSGFAKNMRKGQRVSQGEIIGFVGATGLATGPHLHYEFRINNAHQDPLRFAMIPAAPPLTPDLKPRFDQTAEPYMHRIALLQSFKSARID